VSETGRQGVGLGRSLRELLSVADERAPGGGALFGEPEPPSDLDESRLDAAVAFAAAAMPDDLWGFTAWRPDGGLVTRINGVAEAGAAWSLADVLRSAAIDQLPATFQDGTAVCLAVPAGPGAAIGVRRVRRPLAPRETLFVQAVAGACVLVADEAANRRR
jgi:hypothetical protein